MKCRNPPGPGFLVECLGSQKSVTSELMILRYKKRVAKREFRKPSMHAVLVLGCDWMLL